MSFDVFRQFATDLAKEEEGVSHPLGDGSILIARHGNKAYSDLLSKLVEKHQRDLDIGGEAAAKLNEEIMIRVNAETIFIGFENLAFDGQSATNTLETRMKMLGVKDFRAHVIGLSRDFNAYKLFQEQEQGKP
jgi:hypothetical protein